MGLGDAIETDAPNFFRIIDCRHPWSRRRLGGDECAETLPSAIFAIAQRLSEATPQRKQLIATICSTHSIVNGRNPHRDLHSRHSPDPDDAFMFYAMATNKIDLRGYRFEHRLEDIQTLNERAMRGELHISAVSIHAYAYFGDKYLLLHAARAW